jgi:gentisate 1,2-dioxygenase
MGMAEVTEFMKSQIVQDFTKDIRQYNLGPLWEAIPALMHKSPEPHALAYLWKGSLLEKKLLEAAQIFTPERGGERRAIYLQNPGLDYRQPWGWASTTQTLYAAVQLLQPGEVAPSHRHSQNALRFITKGEGAYSIVQGERIFMEEGDFLITPKNLWHGHGHEGTKPMIWTDILDIPTIYALGGTFFENYPERIEQPKVPDNYGSQRYAAGMLRPVADRNPSIAPLGSYKWEHTYKAIESLSQFEPDEFEGYAVEFINPSTGTTANPTIAAWIQKFPKGFRTKAQRHTHASIHQVYKGSGYSIINGVRFDWEEGDFFCVPNWAWVEHVAAEDTYFFTTNDLPIMEKFDVEKREVYDKNNGQQEVTSEFKPLLP